MSRRPLITLVALSTTLALAACGGDGSSPNDGSGSSAQGSITNCGVELPLGTNPQRVVATSLPGLEATVAMGLTDRIVGSAGIVNNLLPEYREQAKNIHTISTGGFPPPSKEAVMGVNPDFVVSGYEDDFGPKTLGDRATLVKSGLPAYLSEGACDGATIEDARTDIVNYGKLFNVEDKAKELLDALDTELAEAPKATGSPKAIIIQGSPDKPRGHGPSELGTDMIKRAGGTVALEDVEPGTELSWEKIIEAKPDIIIVSETKAAPGDKTIAWIKSYAPAKDVPAVQNSRFLVVNVNDLIPGVRTGKAYRTLAEALAQQ